MLRGGEAVPVGRCRGDSRCVSPPHPASKGFPGAEGKGSPGKVPRGAGEPPAALQGLGIPKGPWDLHPSEEEPALITFALGTCSGLSNADV